MIKNGKEKIKHTGNTYSAPFNCDLTNSFIYENNNPFTHDFFTLLDGQTYKVPNIDFYISPNEVEYTPIEDGNININMLRQSFGAKFIAENLTEGSLKITLSNDEVSVKQVYSPTINIDYPNTTIEDIFLLPPFGSSDENGDYCVNFKVSLVWVKEDGTETILGTPTITFKRAKLTTITIKVDKATENGIIFKYYDTTEELGDGGSYIIDGNDTTEG